MNTTILRRGEPNFPERLSVDKLTVVGLDPPLPPREECVAIIGSRAATEYGMRIAQQVASDLVLAGVTIVSGGAFGIDIASHTAAINTDGRTVVVLPSGINRLHPMAHWPVFAEIGALAPEYPSPRGWLVSQFEDDDVPSRSRFLTRNGTIAELAGAVIIVEGALRSGSMNAVSQAHSCGTPVFAVPGPVTSATSAGPHYAIRRGFATILTDITDVTNALRIPS